MSTRDLSVPIEVLPPASRCVPSEATMAAWGADIRAEHEAVTTAAKTTVAHAMRAGQLLIEAKASLSHGSFIYFLEEHCQIKRRTAQSEPFGSHSSS